jgi:hypothetical protein
MKLGIINLIEGLVQQYFVADFCHADCHLESQHAIHEGGKSN